MPILLLSAGIAIAINSLRLYEYGFQKYHVSQVTGIPYPELVNGARGLISYFNSGEEYISVVVEKDGRPFMLFNEREVIHLKDVKGLFRLDYGIVLGTLIYTLAYAGTYFFLTFKDRDERGIKTANTNQAVPSWRRSRYLRNLAKDLIIGSGIALTLMLILWLVSFLDFEGFFTQFHLLAFSNDFWMLNPYTDYLVMMFPQGFWNDAVLFIGILAAAMAVILGGAAVGHLKFNQKME
jgi:hypothetical protein